MAYPDLVEEINWKSYNPNVYFTSLEGPSARSNRVNKNKNASISSSRSTKRINYSLADLEAKLYTTSNSNENGSENDTSSSGHTISDKYSQSQIIQSKKRFMELDTENVNEQSEVPSLLSTLTGINRDKIESSSGTGSGRSKNKFDIPKNLDLSYNSTKLPAQKRKNTNRIVAVKKILSSKRSLQSFVETLDNVNKHVIFNNVYNKKFFKVLPFITICSVCGGTEGISGCVSCGEKICSVNCFKLHNETRCTHPNR